MTAEQPGPLLCLQSKTLSFHDEGMAVVQETVEDSGRDRFVAEDLAPIRRWLIRREQNAASLVATRHELEEQIRARTFER